MSDEKNLKALALHKAQLLKAQDSTDTLRVMNPLSHSQKPNTTRPNHVVEKAGLSSNLVADLLVLSKIRSGCRDDTLTDLVFEYEQSESSTPCSGEFAKLTMSSSEKETAGTQDSNAESSEQTVLETVTPASVRYEDLSPLGAGGMGRVRRVRDQLLNRVLAMKIIHRTLLAEEGHVLRFIQEAQVVSQLQHPNILPVYDLDVLDNGDVFFTMAEIKGKALSHYIKRVHASKDQSNWQHRNGEWNLHRLVSAVNDVCKAIAYAHENGVVHRDLKPDNIMIGLLGEVLVVDWGLVKVLGERDDLSDSLITTGTQSDGLKTFAGTIYGTPAYLAPELAKGRSAIASTQSDIYALGAILYEVLRGCKPIRGDNVYDLLEKVIIGAIEPFEVRKNDAQPLTPDDLHGSQVFLSQSGAKVPTVLVEACLKAMSLDPSDRYESAGQMVEVIGRWLDGSRRRELALVKVQEGRAFGQEIEQAQSEASILRAQAEQMRNTVESWQSESEKSALWSLQDRADELEAHARLIRVKQIQAFRGALAQKSDLIEAHSALAQHYLDVHRALELSGLKAEADRAEIPLREHTQHLPTGHRLKSRLIGYLKGIGRLDFETKPSNAVVLITQFESKQRRLVAGKMHRLGQTPLRDHPLSMGSYIVRAELEGFHAVSYPVFNRRADHLSGRDPDGTVIPIELLAQGTLGEHDCYVPAGWTFLGGDRQTPNSLPRMRVWLDGFVIQRFAVTNEDYLLFLNDLLDQNLSKQALLHVPREQSSTEEELGAMAYDRSKGGQFSLPKNPNRTLCLKRQPVTMIQWRSARAYAEWLGGKTGFPWSLPMEFEWEKAARGVDGRFFPWGNRHDPSWSCMKDSHPGDVKMQVVDDFPDDVSVYGVRGTAGNTRDWCLDRFRDDGPPLQNSRLLMPSDEDLSDPGFKSTRGGSYGNSASRARSADRDWWFPDRSYVGRGFRLVWRLADRIDAKRA